MALLLSLAALVSCESRKEVPAGETLCSVRLTLSIDTPPGGRTKADISHYTEMQDNPVFRGITDIKMVPFTETEAIVPTSRAHNRIMQVPDFNVLYPSSKSYLFSSGIDAWIPTRTSSVLLYGRAPGFGSLEATGFDLSNPSTLASSLGFSPVPMFEGNGTPAEASVICSILNGILLGKQYSYHAYYGPDGNDYWATVYWNEDISDSALREAYLQITNEGAPISGSGPLVESLLTSLYSLLSSYESHNNNVFEVVVDGVVYEARKSPSLDAETLQYKDLYDGLRDVILQYIRGLDENASFVNERIKVNDDGTIQFLDDNVRTYPENLGLPSGCAVLRWTQTGFVIPQMGGVEGIAPMDRYCYPPSLYYYANTPIRTSASENLDYSGYSSWNEILSKYDLGYTVNSNTKAIALVNKAVFAVGMISATVQASKSRLPDNDGLIETTVDATGENLPVKGIVIGRQYAQSFDFNPVYEENGEYYLYDNDIPGVYLTAAVSAPIRTLSLQTPDNMDAYICLELQNNTGSTFYGADGHVLPGRKFYLVGKLELPSPRDLNSVVVKGYKTTVTCTINSLDGAYNCVPDLGKPQLVLGVQTKINWSFSTPTTVMLE